MSVNFFDIFVLFSVILERLNAGKRHKPANTTKQDKILMKMLLLFSFKVMSIYKE